MNINDPSNSKTSWLNVTGQWVKFSAEQLLSHDDAQVRIRFLALDHLHWAYLEHQRSCYIVAIRPTANLSCPLYLARMLFHNWLFNAIRLFGPRTFISANAAIHARTYHIISHSPCGELKFLSWSLRKCARLGPIVMCVCYMGPFM